MKKFLKIGGITLLSIIGLIVVTLCIALWFVFTPARLTPVLRTQMEKMVSCESKLESADLTLFATFPNLGVRIDNFGLINPTEGAPSDTLLSLGKLTASIDVKSYLKDKSIILHDLTLSNGEINIFIGEGGANNFGIFATSDEEKESEGTFDLASIVSSADLKKIALEEINLRYQSSADSLSAELRGLDMELRGKMAEQIEGTLSLDVDAISLSTAAGAMATEWPLSLRVPFSTDRTITSATLSEATLSVAELIDLQIDGSVSKEETGIATNLSMHLDPIDIERTLAALPKSLSTMVEGVSASGSIAADIIANGELSDTSLPTINATLTLADGAVSHPAIPLPLNSVAAEVSALVEQGTDTLPRVVADIKKLSVATPRSSLSMSGSIEELLADPKAALQLSTSLSLPELTGLLPDTLSLDAKGTMRGNIAAQLRLSDITAGRYQHITAQGNLSVADLTLDYDTLHIDSRALTTSIRMPARGNNDLSFANLDLSWESLAAIGGTTLRATIENGSGCVAIGDPRKTLSASVDLTLGNTKGSMESYGAEIENMHITGRLDRNPADTLTVPSASARIQMGHVVADASPIAASGENMDISLTMHPDPNKLTRPVVTLHYNNTALAANLGPGHTATLGPTDMTATVFINREEENILMRFNPVAQFSISDMAYTNPSITGEGGRVLPITVPGIALTFTPERIDIIDGEALLGNSDFRLEGKIENLASYIRQEALLRGELRFSSNQIDVNQIMGLTSGIGYTDEEISEEQLMAHAAPPLATEEAEEEAMPFMVPKGLSLRLDASVDRALVGGDAARDLTGRISVEDGTLVLEDLNFTTSASEMQLTAMYQSPRPNHLFVGLDFHMLDIEIGNLLNLVPDLGDMMPMLRSFGGSGEFHIAAETYLDRHYNLKPSTIRGAASLRGDDLVVMDGETFSEISRLLRFNKKTENKIDSLTAEFTIFREEIDIYPFLVVMDEYKAIIGGRHNLDMTMDYNVSLIHNPFIPIRLGLDISGSIEDMKFSLGSCKYADLYRPVSRGVVATSQLSLRELIRNALKANLDEEESNETIVEPENND